jgi:hypothetical protein
MTTAQPKATDELRMNAAEFDRIMRGALAVHAPKATKRKSARKRRTAKPK